IKNTMQKGPNTTLLSVDWAIDANPTPPDSYQQHIACPSGSFCNANGTTAIATPAASGSGFLHVSFNFTGPHSPSGATLAVNLPVPATDFVANPVLGVYQNNNHSGFIPPFGNPLTFGLTQGHTYYLYDDETLPNGMTHPGASFYRSTNSNPTTSGDTLIGQSSAGSNGPVSFQASSTC